MSNLTISMVFVTFLTLMMWLSQAAMLDLNTNSTSFYNCQSATMLSSFDKNNCNGSMVLDDTNLVGGLPEGEGAIEPTSGNVFTDTFSSIKNWFVEKTKLNYVYGILNAPNNMLKSIPGMPNEVAFMLGALWYAINLFLIVAFFWGRDA